MDKPIVPDYSAEELNLLKKLSRKSDYHQKCYEFVMSMPDNPEDLSPKQQRWAWGIKNEVCVLLEDET